METTRSALQVGILVCLGVVLFGIGYVFFNGSVKGQNYDLYTVRFTDAGGLSPGSEVDMSGVKVGEVSSLPNMVRLDPATNTALITLQIDKKYHVPVGSEITVSSSLLGGSSAVEIYPPRVTPGGPPLPHYHPGAYIQGVSGFNIAAVGGQTGQLLDEVNKATLKADKLIDTVTLTASNLNNLLSNEKLRQNLIETTDNINDASKQADLLTQQLRLEAANDNSSIEQSLANVNGTTSTISSLAKDNKSKLNQIVDNLNQTTTTLNQLTQSTNRILTKGDVAQNLSDTVSHLDAATTNLDAITTDLHKFTSDPKVNANLRETVDNLAQTTTKTNTLVTRLTSLVGGTPIRRGTGNSSFLANLDFSQNLRSDKFRTDVDLYAPVSKTDFVRAGIYDLTETNELNLQYGTSLPYNRVLDARAGVYAGKVGVGLDYNLFRNSNLSLDLYDPNRFHLDLKARIRLSNQAAVILGGEDLTRASGPVVGVELRR
jgi:phospholipid/cholesterol/gamma-HCH transport system substrate-binding protein